MSPRHEKRQIVVLLCDVRSAQNVGAIFRTADGAGVSKIVLGGYTPGPLDRFGRKRQDIAKAALGAQEFVPWQSEPDCLAFVRKMKREGFRVISVEQSARSVDYRKIKMTGNKILIVFGNETEGLGSEIMELSDAIAEIPMRGKKESLNVSVSAGIVLFRFLFDD